jgi:mono/diheme cytochrome c family protein
MPLPNSIALAILIALAPVVALAEGPGLGQPLGEDEIPFYARHAMPDGAGLPAGGGTAAAGAPIFLEQCGFCHGDTGIEGPIMPPVGPVASYAKPAGRYWPHATTLFDYIRRAMPFHAPKSLSMDEVYAVTAYILHRNALVAEDEVMDARTLASVQMPNRDNFIDLWATQGDKPY